MAQQHSLRFEIMRGSPFVVVQLHGDAAVPQWATKGHFHSITRTSDELSIVCAAANVPSDVNRSHNWACLRLKGPFPFSLTGVLLAFIDPLSSNGIPIFAMSTFDTDCVLIPDDRFSEALEFLKDAGHRLITAGNEAR